MDAIEYVPRLIRACLDDDRKSLEGTVRAISRKLKSERPDLANKIDAALAASRAGSVMTRSMDVRQLPIDQDSRYALVDYEETYDAPEPILDDRTMRELDDFIRERKLIGEFLQRDIEPSNSILFIGEPGVGKTYTAYWLAEQLELPLFSLNLATAISSYLGKSGQNVKQVFDYASSQPSVLLLDEFDAIAKRRDDASDLGELKRLVNVLLMEIETLPKSNVLIAATNHQELIDPAMWRRFDRVLEIPPPRIDERRRLLDRHLPRDEYEIAEDARTYLLEASERLSAARICKLCERIKRQTLMRPDEPIDLLAIREFLIARRPQDSSERKAATRQLKNTCPELTTREIGDLIGAGASTISRYLRED